MAAYFQNSPGFLSRFYLSLHPTNNNTNTTQENRKDAVSLERIRSLRRPSRLNPPLLAASQANSSKEG